MPTKWYYHYCWTWSSILKVLKVIGLQISLQYLKKEDVKGVHFLHGAKHQSFYKLGLLFLMEMEKFYGCPAMFIVTCFLAQPDCRTFLPECWNTIIKQQLRRYGSPLPLLQVNIFQEKQGILQKITLGPSNKPEKACIDTNNFTQSLTNKYHHTATERLYQVCGAKISWTPTFAWVS